MKRVLTVLAIAVAGVVGLSALPQTSSAALPSWPPLSETCKDVTGDGKVDLFNDIVGVIEHYGTSWGDDDYALLYDVSGGGTVDLFNDIVQTVEAYGTTCSLIDTQVVQATVATLKYQDPAVAFADGYEYGSQYIGQMGIHLVNPGFQQTYTTFYDGSPGNLSLPLEEQDHQLTHPVGLVYSDAGANVPDELVGVWYIVPTDPVCEFYAIVEPCYPSLTVMPVGFGLTNDDEDNPDLVANPINNGWHTHTGLCIKDWNTVNALVTGENVSEESCLSHSDYWFSTYGWMMHMYNFVPNPEGRFMKWNTNPDFP